MNYKKIIILILTTFGIYATVKFQDRLKFVEKEKLESGKKPKIYWFIPDGFRAEPNLFKIYSWAKEGKLPNIKWMMDHGAYGYSIPSYPGHTPVNTATLMTGSTPDVHGITDVVMLNQGFPVSMPTILGFSSTAKKVPPIWVTLDQLGRNIGLVSIPGSTPPEIQNGIVINGRWGNWGVNFQSVIFQADPNFDLKTEQGLENRMFGAGIELTKYVNLSNADSKWKIPQKLTTADIPQETQLSQWGLQLYTYIYNSENNQKNSYDRIIFSLDKKNILCDLKAGNWSDWIKVKLSIESKNDYNIYTTKQMAWERSLSKINVDTYMKIKVIRLGVRGTFRVRIIFDNMNEYTVQPSALNESIHSNIGPMIDFVDNYPPQLIYYAEDKKTFLEESEMSLDWHKNMTRYLTQKTTTDLIIHGIYTPNQMLTSRWWLPFLDPTSRQYKNVTEAERTNLWNETLHMYQKIDEMLGEIIKNAEPNSYIILSSDHGVIPLNKEILINNLLAKYGLLKYYKNSDNDYYIDWKNSKAVFTRVNHIYIQTKGLDRPYQRENSHQFYELRTKISNLLKEAKDDDGVSPFSQILNSEDSFKLNLPSDRVGDLILSFNPGVSGIDLITPDLKLFKETLKGGYKQGLSPKDIPGLWTPFAIVGPGVKKNFELTQPIQHQDQYPTLFHLLGYKIPSFVNGKEIIELEQSN